VLALSFSFIVQMVLHSVLTIFHCKQSIFKKKFSSINWARFFTYIFIYIYQFNAEVKSGAIELLWPKLHRRAISKKLGMLKATLIRILASTKAISSNTAPWLWEGKREDIPAGCLLSEAGQGYQEGWMDYSTYSTVCIITVSLLHLIEYE
jgi:hypothetical protein